MYNSRKNLRLQTDTDIPTYMGDALFDHDGLFVPKLFSISFVKRCVASRQKKTKKKRNRTSPTVFFNNRRRNPLATLTILVTKSLSTKK